MAVEAVWSELVSAVVSLIYRENTGKSFETGPSWRTQAPRFRSLSAVVATDSL
jgi:hypothetical protein